MPEDVVDHPHPVWWVLIPGGLTLLAAQGWSPTFYAWWVATMHPLPGKAFMAWLLVACLPIHVFEAGWAFRRAHELGLHRSARGWALQTFLLGYPSTHLLRRRARG